MSQLWWSGPFLAVASLGGYNAVVFATWDAEFASDFQTQEEVIVGMSEWPVVGTMLYALTWGFYLGVLICATWCLRPVIKAGFRYAKRRAVLSR